MASTKDPVNFPLLLKTKIVDNNGLNPIWNEKVQFEVVDDEINMLIVRVHDDDNTLLCWNALPISSLKLGWRAVDMRAPDLKPLHAAVLLFKIEIN